MIQLELTLYRDMKPRSRPSHLILPDDKPGERVAGKLFPGASSDGEHLTAVVWFQGYLFPQWALLKAQFLVEGITYSDPRPGEVYTGRSDMPSGLIHFLPMAPPESPLFGGVHTLALRVMTR